MRHAQRPLNPRDELGGEEQIEPSKRRTAARKTLLDPLDRTETAGLFAVTSALLVSLFEQGYSPAPL